MLKRDFRRRSGLALGVLLSWQGIEARGEDLPVLADGSDAKLVELDSGSVESKLIEAVGASERVLERYPNRLIKIERYVTQDAAGNYFNHGPWAKWSEDGRLMGKGEFRNGAQHGKWVRLYNTEETQTAFASALQLGFEAPFSSMAEFSDGRLHGTWVVLDAKKRQVSAAEFQDGERHGKSLAWHPSGKKFREVEYRAGELDGLAAEFDADERLVKQEKFVNGYRHGIKVEHYATGEVKSECETLFAKEVVEATENWWDGTSEVEVVGTLGRDQRHGKFVAYSLEGIRVLEGNYVDDRPEGRFTWWHDNGNKAIEGCYVEGKQDGVWTWWYSNGLKELTGEYAMGQEAGNWREWQDNGLVATSMSVFETPLYEATEAVDLQPVDAEELPSAEAATGTVSVDGAPTETAATEASLVEVQPQATPQTATAEVATPNVQQAVVAETPAVAGNVAAGESSAVQALFPTPAAETQIEAGGGIELQSLEVQQSSDDLPRPAMPSIRPASFRKIQH